MRKEYVKNILSKKIVIIIFYLIGFLLLVLNFSTNWINGGKTQNIGVDCQIVCVDTNK